MSGGAVRCWGSGINGTLGYNATANVGDGIGLSIVAAGDVPIGASATQIAAGGGHTCALLAGGAVRCWGTGGSGQLGHDATATIGAAGDIPVGGTVTQVVAGNARTCALLTSGAVRCWGDGALGQLGYDATANVGDGSGASILVAGDVPLGGTATAVAARGDHTCALMQNGAPRCWSDGSTGQLGHDAVANIGDGGASIIAAGDIPLL